MIFTRKGFVIHAEQANDPGRDAAHREHGTEGDAARHETCLTGSLFEGVLQILPDDVEGKGRFFIELQSDRKSVV